MAQLLASPQDYALITTDLCHRLSQAGIAYAEITLAAGVVLWKQQNLPEIYAAVQAAALASPVEVKWNLDSIRQFGADLAQRVAEFAVDHRDDGVISIGIGGDEVAGPAQWFADVYKYALQGGLRLTAHAGETAGPKSIWGALEIGAERIGHGIRAIEDPALVRHLAANNIPLEISITSNVLTGAVASFEAHPLRKLYDAGVPITINTDDPAIFRTTLAAEFEIARQHFGFTETELARLRQNAWLYRFA